MLRKTIHYLLLLAVFAFPVSAEAEDRWMHPARHGADEEAFHRIRSALGVKLQAGLPAESLRSLANRLSAEGIPTMVDERSLEDLGIEADSATLPATPPGISLRSALTLQLEQIDLTFMIRHEALVLTTEEAAEQMLETRIYDVSALLPTHRITDPQGNVQNLRDYDTLIVTLTETIAPESWADVGGPGAISALEAGSRALLVISQTERVHEAVETLLRKLHTAGRLELPTGLVQSGRDATATIRRSTIRRSQLPRGR